MEESNPAEKTRDYAVLKLCRTITTFNGKSCQDHEVVSCTSDFTFGWKLCHVLTTSFCGPPLNDFFHVLARSLWE